MAKATGPVVVATTRSGTNQWEAGGFAFRQDNGLIEQDFFALERCRDRQAEDPPQPCEAQPKQDRWQVGANLGGPIIRDRLFFFGSYEGSHQDRASTVRANEANLGQWPTDIQQELIGHEGTHPSEFRSHLFFGKLTYTPGERHRFELIGNVRDEFDVRGFGGTSSFENAEDFNNDVRSISAKHQFNRGNLLNEAQISYQYYRWFPLQLNVDLIGRDYAGTLKVGGRCCPQDRSQKKWVFVTTCRTRCRAGSAITCSKWAGSWTSRVTSSRTRSRSTRNSRSSRRTRTCRLGFRSVSEVWAST